MEAALKTLNVSGTAIRKAAYNKVKELTIQNITIELKKGLLGITIVSSTIIIVNSALKL